MRLGKIRKIYFVGIGGIGMSGIAEVLLNLGYEVNGSDKSLSDITEHLSKKGARIFEGHSPKNIKDADVLVYSSAVTSDNPEVKEANRLKIPVIKRAEMLGELMRLKFGIAIAGTHGKTTTTSLTGAVLTSGALDPTLIIGGKVRSLNTNAQLGRGDFLVAEVDEFDRSLFTIIPTIAVITNIESDHLECYEDMDDLKNSFLLFANKVPFYGKVILCLDSPVIQEILNSIKRKVETYGFSSQADLTARNIQYSSTGVSFNAHYHDDLLGNVKLQIPGKHNVLNALASIAVGLELDVPFPEIQEALQGFSGVNRRFEIKDVINDIMVVDDYAHHPTEIIATLQGARTGWPDRRIVAIFQPHLYSRTKNFYKEFARSFFDADVLIVTEIYPAREEPIADVTGNLIAQTAIDIGHKNVSYVGPKNQIAEKALKILKPGDMVITIGAGDVWRINEQLLKKLNDTFRQTG